MVCVQSWVRELLKNYARGWIQLWGTEGLEAQPGRQGPAHCTWAVLTLQLSGEVEGTGDLGEGWPAKGAVV